MHRLDKEKSDEYNRFELAVMLIDAEMHIVQRKALKYCLNHPGNERLTDKQVKIAKEQIKMLKKLHKESLKTVEKNYAVDPIKLEAYLKAMIDQVDEETFAYIEANMDMVRIMEAYMMFWDLKLSEEELEKELMLQSPYAAKEKSNYDEVEKYAALKIMGWTMFDQEWAVKMKKQFGFELKANEETTKYLINFLHEVDTNQ